MEHDAFRRHTLEEIQERLVREKFPIRGVTELGAAAFHLREPSGDLGIALHAGARVRSGLEELFNASSEERRREEDLYTDLMVEDFPMVLLGRDSRFEYDLNCEEAQCIYEHGLKKWNMDVWKRPLTESERMLTLHKYREFHALLELLVDYLVSKYGSGVLYDIHSFRYQREGTVHWWEDTKPEINLGTRYINREYFAPQVEAFLEGISGLELEGKQLRVGENVLFPGGYLTRKYAKTHNKQVLVLAVEFKKIYMDEWSNKLYPGILELLKNALHQTKGNIPRIHE
jgi:N-formylglutamate amidohydrolase